MTASHRWHSKPDAGLVDRDVGAPIPNTTIAHSDGGVRYFSDVGFPAHREDLYRSALAHGAPPEILRAIRGLRQHIFGSARDVPDLYHLAGMSTFEASRATPDKPQPTGQGPTG